MRTALLAALSLIALAAPAAAQARNILLTNDDGLTSNVVALHAALEAAGHDVIVAVPCQNQSGMGAALYIARPLAPLAQPCLNDAAGAGAPGAGPMTRAGLPQGDFHYVDGTPAMAMMYGLHLATTGRWGALPDLVLSGPNEGQNVGAIILTSGTVSAAQAAAVRGIPAIALSAGSNSEGSDLANPVSAQVAAKVVELVAALDGRAAGGALLPQGLALNVNFPDELAGAEWRVTRIGTYNAYLLDFTMDMAATASPTLRAMAAQRGAQLPSLPGISLDFNRAEPLPHQLADESVVYRQHIAVSPMQAGYEGAPAEAVVRWQLADLLPTAAD
jgi:5'-nucleotidase